MVGQGLFFRSFKYISNSRGLLNNRITNVNLQLSAMNIKQDTRAKLAQLKIPEKPKKPLTPYMRYVSEHRNEISKKYPGMKPTDVIKKCAEYWKNVSSEVKDKYTEAYNLDRVKYEKQSLHYEESLSLEQKEAVQEVQDEKKEVKKKRKLRKLYKETNKPKRPMGAYMRYLVDQSKIRSKPIKDLMGELKEAWSTLPQQEKTKYENEFVKEKQAYDIALKEWEARMIVEGRNSLVRPKSLEEIKPSSRIRQIKKLNPQ